MDFFGRAIRQMWFDRINHRSDIIPIRKGKIRSIASNRKTSRFCWNRGKCNNFSTNTWQNFYIWNFVKIWILNIKARWKIWFWFECFYVFNRCRASKKTSRISEAWIETARIDKISIFWPIHHRFFCFQSGRWRMKNRWKKQKNPNSTKCYTSC